MLYWLPHAQEPRLTGVSFIVTVYNKRPYLADVLSAIRAQRGPFATEYVIVDDGSTDGSLEAVRELTRGWADCRIIAQSNAGASAAMNRAVADATLPYLKLVDADDVLAPDATQLLLDAITESGAVLAIGDGGLYRPGQEIAWPAAAARSRWELMRSPLRRMLQSSTLMNPTTMLLRRDDYLRIGGADEAVCCQDYSIALPLAQLGDFVHVPAQVALVPTAAPGRLSENQARTLHDLTMVLGRFIAQHPELAAQDRAYAVQRAAGRAMLWARRHGRRSDALRYAIICAAARFGAGRDPARTILGCCGAFGYSPSGRA